MSVMLLAPVSVELTPFYSESSIVSLGLPMQFMQGSYAILAVVALESGLARKESRNAESFGVAAIISQGSQAMS